MTLNRRTPAIVVLLGPLLFAFAGVASAADEQSEPARVTAQTPTPAGSFAVERREDGLVITRGGAPVAEYFFRHPKIPRPFFAHLHASDGTLLTRRFPPRKGEDLLDHDTIHPGLWLAFGDLNGVDFWRNKGRVAHVRFVEQPRVEGGTLAFAVEEQYLAPGGQEVCRGMNRFRFLAGDTLRPAQPGIVLVWDSTLRRTDGPLTFGPQHEMGLGFRIVSPLRVKDGHGRITGSHGGMNEAGNWGRVGQWWDYAGEAEGRRAGILAVAAPDNARPVWSHARDYGFLALNPTGPPPDAQDVPSVPFTIPAGAEFRMRVALLFHSAPATESWDPAAAAQSLLRPVQGL